MVDEWFSSAFDAHLLNSDCDFYELNHVNDFNQMMDLTGEEEKDEPICSFDQNCNEERTIHDITTSTINTFGPTLDDIFDFNSAGTCDLDLVLEASTDERNKELPTKKVGDRSRSLISERRRRRRMKEKLYALRALVPEITKMDKASIVADAASYVQNLQKKVKELESEISEIETFVRGTGVSENSNFTHVTCSKILNRMKICQMDIFQVETREFYVRLVCEKGGGVAIALYKAIESLTFFDLRNSNFNTDAERLVFSFTLQITKCEDEVSPRMMKSWIVGALQNQGFDLQRILSL